MANMINTTRNSTMKKDQLSNEEYFMQMSPDLMVIVNFEGAVEYFNDAWIRILGYSREELMEKEFWGIAHPDDISLMEEELSRLSSKGAGTHNIENRLITKKGEVKNISWSSNVDLEAGLIYSVGRDVTALHQKNKAISESEEKFKFISENCFEGILITSNGVAQLANQAYATMFGYDNPDEITGMHYSEFVAENEAKKVNKLVAEKFEGIYESKGKKKDGNYFPVEVQVKSIHYKNKPARIVAIRNIEESKKAQEKIDRTEMRFRSVFENKTVGVLLMNMQGRFVNANEQLFKRLKYNDKEKFFALKITDILDKSEHADVLEVFRELVDGTIPASQKERKFICRDGSIAWSRCTSNVITLQDGEQFVMSLIEDIDQQKQNEKLLFESKEKFRAVYESSPMGIVVTKKPGIIIDANPAFAQMLGYEPEEIIGTNIISHTFSSDVNKTEKWMEKIYDKEVNMYTFEKRYKRKDGSTFWAQAVVSKMNVMSDEVITVGLIENIERKKKTEQTLEAKNKELIYINQELEHFAYVASHDLQEPLRTITSFIQILEKRYSGKLDEDGRQFMGYVVEGAKRMQHLIRDLLEYSRINRSNTNYETVDLNDVYQTVNRVLKDKIDSNDAIILAEHLPVVQGNKVQLTQIFQNLIDNAIKFRGKKKPEIEINVEEQAEKWLFSFKDNGIGISNEYYQRIFVIFQRLHTHEEYTGTGIGLAICKKIIERHGGEIWVESKVNRGTTFHFTIAKNLVSATPQH